MNKAQQIIQPLIDAAIESTDIENERYDGRFTDGYRDGMTDAFNALATLTDAGTQLLDFGELKSAVDDLVETLESAQHEIEERDFEISEKDEQLASQRRTIATLRARLSHRKGRIPPPGNEREARWIRERFDILSDFNQVTKYSDGLSQLGRHWLRKQTAKRIAAIRNFGALP